MGKSKELGFVNYIIIDGEKKLMDNLTEKEKIDIGIQISDRFMKTLGYTRVDKTA